MSSAPRAASSCISQGDAPSPRVAAHRARRPRGLVRARAGLGARSGPGRHRTSRQNLPPTWPPQPPGAVKGHSTPPAQGHSTPPARPTPRPRGSARGQAAPSVTDARPSRIVQVLADSATNRRDTALLDVPRSATSAGAGVQRARIAPRPVSGESARSVCGYQTLPPVSGSHDGSQHGSLDVLARRPGLAFELSSYDLDAGVLLPHAVEYARGVHREHDQAPGGCGGVAAVNLLSHVPGDGDRAGPCCCHGSASLSSRRTGTHHTLAGNRNPQLPEVDAPRRRSASGAIRIG